MFRMIAIIAQCLCFKMLLNTAGVSQFGPVEKATYDAWDWQIDVNLKGMINGVQTFVPR
jgi:NADP-dependent 3-hydroxy acid dehydrogenase YdfG